MDRPILSIIVVFYNMTREAPRTLYTLSSKYQRGTNSDEYEVIIVDNGSTIPLDKQMVESFGPNFRLYRRDPSPSPAAAINAAVKSSHGNFVMICIDGARMLSPGIINFTLAGFKAYRNSIISTLGYHLGPKIQRFSIPEGYNRNTEDLLLDSVDWRENGYNLFKISALAGASRKGWFCPLGESNCLSMKRIAYEELGGYDERFQSPGGGLVNHDFYKRACDKLDNLILLLGEGTFHQIHGGVATNMLPEHHPYMNFHNEYVAIRGFDFIRSKREPIYFGSIPNQSFSFLSYSVEVFERMINKNSTGE